MSEWDLTGDIGSVRMPPRQHCPQSAKSLIQSCTCPPLGQKRALETVSPATASGQQGPLQAVTSLGLWL